MKSICFLTDMKVHAVNSWNVYDLVETLKLQGVKADFYEFGRKNWTEDWVRAFNYDIVVFYRCISANYSDLIARLKSKGIRIGFSVDDLIWDPTFPYACPQECVGHIHDMFKAADFFVLPSEFLAEKIKALGYTQPIIWRKPGMLERRFYRMKKIREENPVVRKGRPFSILLNKGHVVPEQRKLTLDIFSKMAESVKEHVDVSYFTLMGKMYPEFIGSFQFHAYPFFQFEDYFDWLARAQIDAIFCPLPKDDFHDAKSYPKYLEAGSANVQLVGSDVYPFSEQCEAMWICKVLEEWTSVYECIEQGSTFGIQEDVEENHLLGPIAKQFYADVQNA